MPEEEEVCREMQKNELPRWLDSMRRVPLRVLRSQHMLHGSLCSTFEDKWVHDDLNSPIMMDVQCPGIREMDEFEVEEVGSLR